MAHAPYVIGAAFDGVQGYFVPRERAAAFLAAHAAVPVVFHNAAFDLAVLDLLDRGADIYSRVDGNRVWDTQLLHKLYVLATAGHTATRAGESTLEACARLYAGVDLPKDVTDAAGNPIRLSYGRFLNCSLPDMPDPYLRYLAVDAVVTFLVYENILGRIDSVLADAAGVWGYESEGWLGECRGKWGPLTHHVQLKASVVLAAVTRNGLHVAAARDRLVPELEAERGRLREALLAQGVIIAGKGSQGALQAKFKKLAARHPDVTFPLTEAGRYATDAESLGELAGAVPFVGDLLAYRAVDKLLGSFLVKLARPVVRPSFGVLVRTGRTSSFGEMNAQNLPRDDRVRNCFVPSPGRVFLDLDYDTIELGTLAHACAEQFGLRSRMRELINAGRDLHRTLAARVTGKDPAAVTKGERGRVKAINFGKPGGMGDRALRAYAKTAYGVEYTEAEVSQLSEDWLDLFPEMRRYLADETDVPLRLAERLGLTPWSHADFTGSRRFAGHPENAGRGDRPHRILGCMCLKVLGSDAPARTDGTPYSDTDVDYFWAMAGSLADELPPRHARALRERAPSRAVQRAVADHVGRAGVFTLAGRLRAGASYTARRNTVFQGLAADGAKLALWQVWRAGYRVVNFVHDQLLVEVPVDGDLTAAAEELRGLMVAAMSEVVPGTRVRVSYAACDRWSKDAEEKRDAAGRLLVWSPPADRGPARAQTITLNKLEAAAV